MTHRVSPAPPNALFFGEGVGKFHLRYRAAQYGFPTDGSADAADPDHDGMNNWQEWICRTDPRNRLSVLRMLSASPLGTSAAVIWQSVAAVSYCLERSTNPGSPFALVATNVVGQAGTTTYSDTNSDTNAIGAGPFFYRVGVQNP